MNFNYYFELYLKQVVFDFVNSQFEEPITKLELLSISIEDREELNFICYVSLNVNDNYKLIIINQAIYYWDFYLLII